VEVDALGVSILGEHEDAATARIRFASGCVADLSVCRVAPQPKRWMQVWSAEGLAVVDFAARRLTCVTPSESLRRGAGIAGDVTLRDAIKSDWFQRHVQVRDEACESRHDQLTCELLDFVHCVRTGCRPRVSGDDGRDAVALAWRVLDSLRQHAWTADADGPRGPRELFIDGVRRAAA
jgi:predicted dehydrogenase